MKNKNKKYKLFVDVIDKVVGESSKRSSNESVTGNKVNKVGMKFVNYIGDDQAQGLDSLDEQSEDKNNE